MSRKKKNELTDEIETVEVKIEESQGEEKVETAEGGLSTRDAFEVAIQALKDKTNASDGRMPDKFLEKDEEDAEDVETKPITENDSHKETLQPPSEWTKEEKEDFLLMSPKAQEASLRLHNSRQKTVYEIRKAKEELAPYKQLAESADPFIRTLGVKEPREVALNKALRLWYELENAKNPEVVAAVLRAKGIELPEGFLEKNSQDDQNSPVLQKLNEIESRFKQQEISRVAEFFAHEMNNFCSKTNAAGKPLYPDLNESKLGQMLASGVGTLCSGRTPESQKFIASVRERIPELSWDRLIHEAYIDLGGRVDDSKQDPRPDSHSTQKHIALAKRAASSKPGGGATNSSSGPVKLYSNTRDALSAAQRLLTQE